ncbi:MAG: 6-phosphofructokinase [Candidatus Hydrogenedentes bacterium]|nr:6-phosphofructokinase [Candidatus Hydrogenedentota bacterium]
MSNLKGNLLVAQGGGPTAVINQSLVGVITEARKYSSVEKIFGAKHGVKGIIDESFLDLTNLSSGHLEAVAKTPSSALLSTRHKPKEDDCKRIFEVFKKYNIRYFVYIGGNDSAETCHTINKFAKGEAYEISLIHVPKTIDNDLKENDHCPGFPSAAKYVAQAFVGINLDNKALPGIHLVVVMGRNSGFLTASSAYGRKYEDDGPHLIYIPERPLPKNNPVDKIVSDVQKVYEKLGRCIIAISEGITVDEEKVGEDRKLTLLEKIKEELEKDSFGHEQLSGTGALGDTIIEKYIKLKIKTSGGSKLRARADTLGYPQRSFLGCVSEVDQREAREVGEKAVQFAVGLGKTGSVTIKRIANYAVEYVLEEKLEKIGGQTRYMEDIYINSEGNDITPAYIEYLKPLIGELPVYEQLQAPKYKQ